MNVAIVLVDAAVGDGGCAGAGFDDDFEVVDECLLDFAC